MFVHTIEELLEVIRLPLVFLGVGIESIGIPIPGETVLVIAAVAAGRGTLVPWQVALCAWAGAVIGDNMGYALGHHYDERFWTLPGVRRFFRRERVERTESFFERRSAWLVVFLARFVAILRIFVGPVAGISRMRWHAFLTANALGGACWVALVMVIGLLVGSNLQRALKIVERGGYIGLALAVLLFAVAVFFHLRARRRGGRKKGERKRTSAKKVA